MDEKKQTRRDRMTEARMPLTGRRAVVLGGIITLVVTCVVVCKSYTKVEKRQFKVEG